MTRQEFLDDVTTFDELHSFCIDIGYDLQEDGAYSEEEYNASLQRINENIEEIKQHLLDDSMVVKKGTDRLTVKIFPN